MSKTIKINHKKGEDGTETKKPIRHKVTVKAKSTKTELGLEHSLKEERRAPKQRPRHSWDCITLLILGGVSLVGGIACFAVALTQPQSEMGSIEYPTVPSQTSANVDYSDLTGEPLINGVSKNAPAYCIQTPNGTDGARPQAGLTQAGVVFEAIAEAGITRFAAIYQNPTSAVIGPIRSLRIYYLDWDTPFDCTIVHAGGSGDALSAVASGGYKDLTEDYSYMYRGNRGQRLWNNLFTTAGSLQRFAENHGYNESNIHGFARMTPEESSKNLIDEQAKNKLDITKPTLENTSELAARVSTINLTFGGSPTFNVNYTYDAGKNVYQRSYQTGQKHEVYKCPDENLGERNPEDVCELTQMMPNVVVAMVVNERRANDNYHEDITTTGSGKAYIFQNGSVVEGTWNKPSKNDQIKFIDGENREIKLAPGQTFVSAIPSYGSVEY